MSKKIRVLEITHGLAPGGIESFIINILENIDRENLEISMVIACEGTQHHEERVSNQGIKIYRTSDLNGIKNIVRHFFRLIKLLKKEGPFDVVHTHIDCFNGVNLLAAFIAGVPVRISHAHNTNSANSNTDKPSICVKIYRYIMRSLIKSLSTDKLGCSNEANMYMYGKKYYTKSKVIYNGIDLSKFNKCKSGKNIIECDIHLDRNNLNFITIGRICEQKNSIFILNVINELRKINNNIKLYWVGKGPLEKEINSLIKEYKLEKNIELLGSRSDISELLSLMDFMIFPSRWEGLPVALIEAQVAGVPCFISNKISNEADLGLCTSISIDESKEIWAHKINTFIKNNTYNKTINNEILKKFDIKEVSNKIKEIYEHKFMDANK